MPPLLCSRLSFDIIGTGGENAVWTRLCRETEAGPVQASVPASPARATRKYYKGRKGPMLRAHTSLTFTQKILPPTTQSFSVSPPHPPPSISRPSKTAQSPDRRGAYGREAEEGAVGVGLRGVSFRPTRRRWKWLRLTSGKHSAQKWKRAAAS